MVNIIIDLIFFNMKNIEKSTKKIKINEQSNNKNLI